MAPLNPNAPAFFPVPAAIPKEVSGTKRWTSSFPSSLLREDDLEDNITPEELEEIETAEEWVRTMAFMEELEREHLIELALRHAPYSKVAEIHKRVGLHKTPAVNRKPSKPMLPLNARLPSGQERC